MTTPRLPLDKRVEQAAHEHAQSLLAEFPELTSVAVVVDWNLPGWAGDSLPAAVWLPAPGVHAPGAMANMQPQLARAMAMLMRAHFGSVMAAAQERPSREDPSKRPDTDAGAQGAPESDGREGGAPKA